MNSIGAFTDQIKSNYVVGYFGQKNQEDSGSYPKFADIAPNEQGGSNKGYGKVMETIATSQEVLMKKLQEKLGLEVEESKPLSSQEVADNILSFVTGRIELAASQGATEEELQDLLSQAKEGIEKGFSEALDILDDMGRLTEGLSDDIEVSRQLVDQGVEDLASELNLLPTEERVPSESKKSEDSDRSDQQSAPATQSAAEVFRQNRAYGLSEKFSFEVITQDGDRVTVYADYNYGAKQETLAASNGNQGIYGERFSSSESTGFSLSVEGELDEDELQALDDLFGQVMDLSQEFYNGDFDTAFNMAMELNMDTSELSYFSLNLTKVETASQVTEYAKVGDQPQVPGFVQQQLKDMGDQFRSAFDQANLFNDPSSLLKELIQKFEPEDTIKNDKELNENKLGFIDDMVAMLEQFQKVNS